MAKSFFTPISPESYVRNEDNQQAVQTYIVNLLEHLTIEGKGHEANIVRAFRDVIAVLNSEKN